jgi:hypothetical protein
VSATTTPYQGRLNSATQYLSDISLRDPYYPDDVPLAEMPTTNGPFTYDAANKLAVPVPPRKPRPLFEIRADVQALSASQWTNTWNALSAPAGSAPRLYLTDYGPNVSGIFALDWSAYASGGTAAQVKAAQVSITACYCQDQPSYLVHPPFDNSINIPGDELA